MKLMTSILKINLLAYIYSQQQTTTPVQRLFVRDYPGEPVPNQKEKKYSGFYWNKRQ